MPSSPAEVRNSFNRPATSGDRTARKTATRGGRPGEGSFHGITGARQRPRGSPPPHAALRAADLGVAGALLLLTLPLFLLVALALRLEAPGPVLLREPRIGHAGRRFNLLSFRSTVDGPFRRPLPSRVGRLIRPARIDQLPVLLNLLRGDMTLVGPAPAPVPSAWEAPSATAPQPGLSGLVGAD